MAGIKEISARGGKTRKLCPLQDITRVSNLERRIFVPHLNTFATCDRSNFSPTEASYNYQLVHLCCPHCRLLFRLTTSGQQVAAAVERRSLRRDLPSKLSGSGHSGLVTPARNLLPPVCPFESRTRRRAHSEVSGSRVFF